MIDLRGWLKSIWREAEIVENHLHPDISVTTPNGRLRVGALTFSSAADTETVTLGFAAAERIYTFKAALGAPAANNCHVKVQGSVALTVQKFCDAINGVTDAANIAYGDAAAANPAFRAAYTGVRVAIGTVPHPTTGVGPTAVFIGKLGDNATVATLSDTVSHAGIYKLTAITRIYSSRYILTGNHANLISRVAGDYQCVCPMNSVVHPTELVVCKYDVGKMVAEAASSNALIYECDGYYSSDEVTFTPLWYGLEMSRDEVTKGCQMFPVNSHRIPAGAGFYIKARSNGTDAADYIDFKAQYHVYPTELD
jgi:hypothetical protein